MGVFLKIKTTATGLETRGVFFNFREVIFGWGVTFSRLHVCLYLGVVAGPCTMGRLTGYFIRFWRWVFKRKRTDTASELSQRLVLGGDLSFEFIPAPAFLERLGGNVQFLVTNPLDLLLQERGLMAEALVVEASIGDRRSVLWFRYNAVDLAARGESSCTLFADDADRVFDGVCGKICSAKRI